MKKLQRVTQAELDQIKRDVSVADLARRRGVELKPHGKDLIGLCPFHNDTNPSLVITPDKNLWHCLGACQAGGDVITWVMKAEGVSFRHAIELLRRQDIAVGAVSTTSAQTTVKKIPSPFDSTADDQNLLNRVADFYHQTLKESPEALAYLERRKIGHAGALDHFKLGYGNRTLGYRLPFSNRRNLGEVRRRLNKMGVYRTSGHEHFNGSVVIPVMDENGNVTEMYGRKIRDDLRDGTAYHLYLPGPHKGVWNISSLAASPDVILCEALIDALTFWCAGYKNVTSSYGVEGFTPDHLAAFKKYNLRKVLIAYDRDEAGDRAAAKLAPKLIEQGFEVFRVEFPLDIDANDFARSVADPADALGVLLRGAMWLGKGARPGIGSPPQTQAAADSAQAAAKEIRETSNSIPLAEAEPALPDPLIEFEETTIPQTPAAAQELPAASDKEAELTFDDRAWRVRGIEQNLTLLQLRVNVRVRRGERYHLDTFDLHIARFREMFIRVAARELNAREETIKSDLGHVLRRVEEIQDAMIRKRMEPKDPSPHLSAEEQSDAIEFLSRPDLLSRIAVDFAAVGYVGEETNVLVGYLASISRKLDPPLSLIIQSSTAAGKSTLMDAVLSLVPQEDYVKYTAVTGQALFYMSETNLKQKIIAIAEEKGAERAGYALKLLQSEGRLTIAATGKDPKTGKLVTQEYHVEGPAAVFITTTNVEIDEEVLNRALVLTVDEDREQTRRIHDIQRESQTLDGLLHRRERSEILRRHQNAQRMLKPLSVVNPYARRLTFLDTRIRLRRDHMKYLTLIRAVTLLHQYQRPVRHVEVQGQTVSYIESTPEDIATANHLAHEVLGRSLDDLAPQTRRLLMLLDDLVTAEKKPRSEIRFSRRLAREYTGWSDTALKVHLRRLEELEYLAAHRNGHGQSFVYELLYDGQGHDGKPFLMGLIDVETLTHTHDDSRSGQNAARSGSGQPPVSPKSGGGQGGEITATSTTPNASNTLLKNRAKTHIRGDLDPPRRNRSDNPEPLAAKE